MFAGAMVSRDTVSLAIFGVLGVGTFAAILLASQWKRDLQANKEAWERYQAAAEGKAAPDLRK